jgi:phytoene desaturase
MKNVIIIGAGLGGLATALRLSHRGYKVKILEKHSTPGGRLNQLKMEGFTFDIGPSFMSMSYELDELFNSCSLTNTLTLKELNPLYQVFFAGNNKPYQIWKDLDKLQEEFKEIEPNLKEKAEKYLNKAGEFFHDTEDIVIKSNFDSVLQYLLKLTRVPVKHIPYLFRKMWDEVNKNFESTEIKVIFSLVAFFLGSTPFRTPAIYSLLNYTEMRHNGYWVVEGGMYKIVETICAELIKRGVEFHYNTEVVSVNKFNGSLNSLLDNHGKTWEADIFVSNSDAASFRGKILNRPRFSDKKLDNMDWTLAPFTVYLGVKGKIDKLKLHNYFLGNNFKNYAETIFETSAAPEHPYYYVNALSREFPESAPDGCENLFILCPVPDKRFKHDWHDKESFADTIIKDLSERIDFNIADNLLVKQIYSPDEWEKMFNLYKGSGLGLAHGMNQVGAFRPRNKDEEFSNLYYVGASTTPGTGLPMVIISSRLVTERITNGN